VLGGLQPRQRAILGDRIVLCLHLSNPCCYPPISAQDYQAALDFVHSGSLDPARIDASRIGLWGVSYSGACPCGSWALGREPQLVRAPQELGWWQGSQTIWKLD